MKLNYLLFLPEGYESSGEKKWPLMLFLHGAGESGNDLEKVKLHGPPKIVGHKKDFPFIVVSPQSPGRGWNPDTLNALLDDVVAHNRVDPDRVYLTGLSMGGFGTWALAAAHPDRFAAIAPICGGGNPQGRREAQDPADLGLPRGQGPDGPPVRFPDDGQRAEEGRGPRGEVHHLPRRRPRLVDRDLQQPGTLRLAPRPQAGRVQGREVRAAARAG